MASNDDSETEGSELVSNLLETIASFQAEEMVSTDPAPSNQATDQQSDEAYLESHMIVPDPGEGKRVEVLWGGKYWRAKTMRRKVDKRGSEWILIKWGSDGWLCTWSMY
jgi:membrane protein implicated in regulation of membrane protease activity